MRWRVQWPKSPVRGQILAGVMVNMRRSIIHYQMYSTRSCPTLRDLTQRPQKMLMIISIKTTSPHQPIKYIQCHQQCHCAVSLVLKLLASNLTRSHRLPRSATRQSLNTWLLVNTNDYFTPTVQPPNPFVTPQYLRRSKGKIFINGGRLPVTTAVRLQTGPCEYARHRCVVNRLYDGLLDNYLLKCAAVPARQMQPIGAWISASDALDLDLLEGGKKPLAARYVHHRILLRRHAAGIAATNAKRPCETSQSTEESQQCVHLDQVLAAHERDWRFVGLADRLLQFQSSSDDHLRSICIQMAHGLSSQLLLDG